LNVKYRESVNEAQILDILDGLFGDYAASALDGEPFGDFLVRNEILSQPSAEVAA